MKHFLSAVGLLLVTVIAHAQTTFERVYGGVAGELGFGVQQTTDGGYILSGASWSEGNGSGDIQLVRVDEEGDVLWTSTFGTAALDFGYSVRQTTDGGFVVAGMFNGFENDTLTVIRTDANGSMIWEQQYPGSLGRDLGYAVRQCTDGGFVVCGSSGTSLDDAYVVRTDAAGTLLWSSTIDLGAGEMAMAIEQTTDGGFITLVQNSGVGNPDGELYLLRLSTLGDTLWTRTIVTPGPDEARGLTITDDGGYIIAGGNGYPQRDRLIVRFDDQGLELWRQVDGDPAVDDLAMAIHQVPGGYAIGGRQEDPISGNIGMYLALTDDAGVIQWERRFHRGIFAEASDMVPTNDGGYALFGSTVDTLNGSALTDMYLVKTDGAGYSALPEIGDRPAELLLFPNPVADRLHILSGPVGNGTLTCHDALGRTVLTHGVGASRPIILQVDHLAPGTYSALLTTKAGLGGYGRFVVRR